MAIPQGDSLAVQIVFNNIFMRYLQTDNNVFRYMTFLVLKSDQFAIIKNIYY